MTLLDPPVERRLTRIEADLAAMKTDLEVIKAKLDAVPSRWLQAVFAVSILVPIYGILAALLVQVLK